MRRKSLFALLVSAILALFLSLGTVLTVQAEEELPNNYFHKWDEWVKQGKTLLFTKSSAGAFYIDSLGYSGYDVVIGDYVIPIPTDLNKGQIVYASTFKGHAYWYPSIYMLYINDTDQPWPVTYHTINGTQYTGLVVDGDGRVIRYENTTITLEFEEGDEKGDEEVYYDVVWDFENEEALFIPGEFTKHKPVQLKQLTYGELGTTYPWLTKDQVEANKAEGVVFEDDDLIFMDLDGKYTNVEGEDYAPVMNEEKGTIVPPGGFLLFLNYADVLAHNVPGGAFRQFHNYINGEPNTAYFVLQEEWFTPIIEGHLTDDGGFTTVTQGTTINFGTKISAKDINGATLPVTTTMYKFNPETKEFDIEIDLLDDEDNYVDFTFDELGSLYRMKHRSEKSVGSGEPLVTEIEYEVYVVLGNAPVFSGLRNRVVGLFDQVDLLEGVTAHDGYGIDITSFIKVHDSALDVFKPGRYVVRYEVTNGYGITTVEEIIVTVLDTEAPKAYVLQERVVIAKGTNYDLTANVHGQDPQNTVISKVVVDDDFFDKDRVGEYTIKVQVRDAAGNGTIVSYILEVVEEDQLPENRIQDLEEESSALKDRLANLEQENANLKQKLNDKENSLKNDYNKKIEDLNNQLEDLQSQLKKSDTFNLVLAIVAGVLATAALALAFVIKKK